MKVAGILRCSNEADWIGELMQHHIREVPHIYFLADDDDGTSDIVTSFPEVVWHRRIDDLAHIAGISNENPDKRLRLQAAHQTAMDAILEDLGEGVSIVCLFGDELFYHPILQMIQRAIHSHWTAIVYTPMHFFLHTSQQADWDTVWANKPVLERLRFYCPGDTQIGWPGSEVKAFRPRKGMKYDFARGFCDYPEGVEKDTNPAPYPLYLHCGYRTPEQTTARVRRNADRQFNVDHRGLLDKGPFVNSLEGFKEMCEFPGSFGSRDRLDLYTYNQGPH